MTEQGALLKLMIEKEMEKQKDLQTEISNHLFDSPKTIKLEADEIAFISFIRIEASSNFVLNYSSTTESRKIEKAMAAPMIIENNIITKHLSSIKFDMSNSDKYQVSVVIVKFIK